MLAAQIFLVLWQVVSSALRVFTVDSVRAGMVDVRPLPPGGKVLVGIGFVVTFLFLAATIFSDQIRSAMPLEPLSISSSPTRGLLVPGLAVPATICGLALAWSFVLAGALRMHRAARVIAYLSFLAFGSQSLSSGMTAAAQFSISDAQLFRTLTIASWATFAALGAALVVLPMLRLPRSVDFAIVAALVTLYAMPGLIALARSAEMAVQVPIGRADSISDALFLTTVLLVPFRMISGMEIVNVAHALSSASVQAVRRHVQRTPMLIVTLAILVARIAFATHDLFITDAPEWQQLLAAIIVIGGAYGLMLLYRNRRSDAAPPFLIIVLTIVAFTIVNMTLIPLMQVVVSALLAYGIGTNSLALVAPLVDPSLAALNQISDFYGAYGLLLLAFGAAVAAVLRWRHRDSVSPFLAGLAWLGVCRWLTSSEQPLAAFRWDIAHLDFVVLLGATGLLAWRCVQRSVDVDFLARVLGVAIFFAFLQQSNLLDNPLSGLSGLASVLILSVGLAWNVLTSGSRFLNAGSPSFPRLSRALVYFGYVMLTVCVTFWLVISHTASLQSLAVSFAMTGFELFGISIVLFTLINGAESLDGADA